MLSYVAPPVDSLVARSGQAMTRLQTAAMTSRRFSSTQALSQRDRGIEEICHGASLIAAESDLQKPVMKQSPPADHAGSFEPHCTASCQALGAWPLCRCLFSLQVLLGWLTALAPGGLLAVAYWPPAHSQREIGFSALTDPTLLKGTDAMPP